MNASEDDASKDDALRGSPAGDSASRPSMSPDRLRAVYDDLAPRFERFDRVNRLLTDRYRRRVLAGAEGRVLDVACGTGENFPYLPADVDVVGVDISPGMLASAAERAAELGIDADLREMDAASLSFPDASFDTVVSSLSTCTFPDPEAALREMSRVCAPGGRILLFEHGRSTVGPVARFQDWRADAHFAAAGCRWNQEPLDVVAAAGLDVRESWDGFLGIFTGIEAAPSDA
ncbi:MULTISPECIES: class I SAM-dependent methyltransferase [Halorussus]|uniref:class I SAM-dependent methyltransferase n=1 Tax=Halorussus TaxID=1070314 RepID=UPI0020A1E4C8|nr:methyltransferase domain-containing protein [Halorussus vallis]USZ76641.1 methyltransferase domain-containing protein [Halorussus vallis]